MYLMLDIYDPWERNETNLLEKNLLKNVPDVGYLRPMKTQWNKSSHKKNSIKKCALMYIYDLWELKQIFSQKIMLKKCDDVGYLRPCLQYLIAEFSGEVVFFATWMFPPSADLNRKNS